MSVPQKPLGQKAYGSIGHMVGSRMGPADHSCTEGQTRIATVKTRDKHDRVFVQEKLDGSCCAIAKIGGEVVALQRKGYLARTSPFKQHHMFADWVENRKAVFEAFLEDGERLVGEWLAQAHGTRYDLSERSPFVAFDIMRGMTRATTEETLARCAAQWFDTPKTVEGPLGIEAALEWLGTYGFHGALDQVEGAMWRVERQGKVDFLCKFVRPDKVDGSYLEAITGGEPVWNWSPDVMQEVTNRFDEADSGVSTRVDSEE